MSSLSYWEARKAKDMFRHMEQADRAADGIAAVYLKASRHMSLELDQIFEKFQSKHGLTQQEAKQLLNTMKDKTSVDALKEALRAGSGDRSKAQLLAELESPAYQARLERLQQLQDQIDLTMRDVYRQEKVQSTSHYVNLASDAYYKNIFNVQSQTGIGFGFDLLSPAAIDQVINSKWSGANYSTRIWNNTQALAQELKEELLVNMVTGRTDRETAEIIADRFAVGASQARRLVRTESCNIANQMDMAGYEECGIEKYRYVATLDLRTSSICREMDGKVFLVSKQQPGLNCPPMHPWCRSSTISEPDAQDLAQMERRARDPVTGKVMRVPADMKYGEWKQKYIKSEGKQKTLETKPQEKFMTPGDLKKHREDTPQKMTSFLEKYTQEGFAIVDKGAEDAFAYHPDKDIIVVNPEHPQYGSYNLDEIMVHEVAHRVDQNEIGSPMNPGFSTSLVELSDRLMENKAYYQSILAPGGKMEYNDLISDIVASITHNEITGVAYHDIEYIRQLGNKELEVFADTFTILYRGDNESVEFIWKELPELYDAFIKMLGV